MKKNVLATLVLGVLFLVGCKNDEPIIETNEDYFIFGHFYGMCAGEECVEIFKIQDGHLYEDSNDTYPQSNSLYSANWTMLPQATYELVNDAVTNMPMDILTESDTVLGMPDAGDWGGLYIEYKNGNTHRFWLVDMMSEGYLAPFVAAVREDIELINQ